MIKTMHFFVSGRVQGVFFRASTRHQANTLGLTGWVQNLADGRVEGMATGEEGVLQEFEQWLQQGPDMAKVSKLETALLESQLFDGFRVR